MRRPPLRFTPSKTLGLTRRRIQLHMQQAFCFDLIGSVRDAANAGDPGARELLQEILRLDAIEKGRAQ